MDNLMEGRKPQEYIHVFPLWFTSMKMVFITLFLNIVLLKKKHKQTESWACHYANCIPKLLLQGAEGKFFPSFVTSSTDGKATNKLLFLAKKR